jgi:hypothetical protein
MYFICTTARKGDECGESLGGGWDPMEGRSPEILMVYRKLSNARDI